MSHCKRISSWLRAIPAMECPRLPSSHPASAQTSLTLLPLPDVRRLLPRRAWDGEGLIRKHQQLLGKNQGCSHLHARSPFSVQLQGCPLTCPRHSLGTKATGKGDTNQFHPLHTPASRAALTPILSASALTDTWANSTPLRAPVEN